MDEHTDVSAVVTVLPDADIDAPAQFVVDVTLCDYEHQVEVEFGPFDDIREARLLRQNIVKGVRSISIREK